MILTTFLMHHKELGDKSFWAPYIELMPDVTFFADWSTDEILATHDPFIVAEAVEYRDELDEECRDLMEVLRRYPHLFNG